MLIDKLESEAKATASKHVINMLQRPGQLEKVEQFVRRVTRKRIFVEAMLKTTMQSQVDGVCSGLAQLQCIKNESKQMQANTNAMNDTLKEVPELVKKLYNVREKNMQYSQYLTAMENFKILFTVQESVEKTKQWILEGKLLYAHHSLNDLENSRDELLFELHKIPNQPADKILLKACFEDVESASNMLEKQVRLVLSRTLNTVRKEPSIIVTALRIVVKEETKDAFALQRQKQSGFLPPGRPKNWKAKIMEVLKESVAQRIEGTQVQERSSNKMWLVVHLELTRLLILEDLKVVKTLCEPCFPKDFNIVEKYVNMYHNCLSNHLEEIINNGLESNEYVTMLSWVENTYLGPTLMNHPDLNINSNSLEPLLSPKTIYGLRSKYLQNMEDNYVEWMQKTLETEQKDWREGVAPENDQEGHFRTAAPVIIFQMIDQNLEVTRIISQDLTDGALILSMKQVRKYGNLYREAIIAFKSSHFEDRSKVENFTHHMITIVNNCMLFVELAQKLKQLYWRTDMLNKEMNETYSSLIKTFQDLRDEAAQWLLEEAFLDLENHFEDLITPKWMSENTKPTSIETVCATLEDYFQDYRHLLSKNFDYVLKEAENLVSCRYLSALFRKRITLDMKTRKSAGDKIEKEMEQLKEFFSRKRAQGSSRNDSPFEAICQLAEILKVDDKEIFSLLLHALFRKYLDFKEDHIIKFLSLRGDLSRSEIKDIVSDLKSVSSSRSSFSHTIFHQVASERVPGLNFKLL